MIGNINLTGDVLCMGAINMDLVMTMEHLPEPGETVVTDNFSTFPGGKGGNQAVAASVLGGNVSFFGKLGGDDFSQQLIRSLADNEVQTAGILRDVESTAGIAIIRVDSSGQNSISFTPGANALLSVEEVEQHPEHFKPGTILLITMEIKPDTAYTAIRAAKRNGMLVILDPAPPPQASIPDDIPALVDIIKPNESEAKYITGIDVTNFESAEAAVKKMLAMGFGAPIVTLGEQGAVAAWDGQIIRLEPMAVESVDSTAAGDVFSGALAAHLSQGNSITDALDFAKVAAALSTTVPGAQTSVPSLNQVLAAVQAG